MAEKDIVFHLKQTSDSDGEIYRVQKNMGIKELIICISGDSASRTVQFQGATFGEDAFCPITGFKEGSNDFETANSTTGNNELWRFDLTGLVAVRFPVSAISGGHVTVKGRAVG